MMQLTMSSRGNPDFDENPAQAFSPTLTISVSTFEEASAACRAYIEKHDLGGSVSRRGGRPPECRITGACGKWQRSASANNALQTVNSRQLLFESAPRFFQIVIHLQA